MQVIAFDLGNTLLEYAGLPLSWESHYGRALESLAAHLGTRPDPGQLARAGDILRRFNTRLNPRTQEVAFATILGELAAAFGAEPGDEMTGAAAFFRVFQQRLRVFPDTIETVGALRRAGFKIGVFTDVPYGMPRELVLKDIADVGLTGALDVLLTSRDAGYRKPSGETLHAVATALGCNASEMAYIGDERKDIDAARAFGCRAILLDRSGAKPSWGQHETIRSLSEARGESRAE